MACVFLLLFNCQTTEYIYEENVNSVSVLCPYALYNYADIIVAFVDFYVYCIT